MSFIKCYNDNGNWIGRYDAPFDMEVDCYSVVVCGDEFSGMKLRGKCEKIAFSNTFNYNDVDLSGFMDLKTGNILVGYNDKGLLNILELNCKRIENVWNEDKKLCDIVNKYLSEQDPLMRDIEGFKLEMAVNGYGNRL